MKRKSSRVGKLSKKVQDYVDILFSKLCCLPPCLHLSGRCVWCKIEGRHKVDTFTDAITALARDPATLKASMAAGLRNPDGRR